MENLQQNIKWPENVIIADADYIDSVAFNLSVNFERMLERRIGKADLARWIDCVALDGGLRPGNNNTQVVLVHGKETTALENFLPANYKNELDGMAFTDQLGEFCMAALNVEDMVHHDDFLLDIIGTVCQQRDVRRIMIIPNAEEGTLYNDICETLRRLDAQIDDKRITLFTMEPLRGGNFRQELLGYSLMNALGIRGDEFAQKN